MDKSDICIYAYLALLGACCVVYGFIVVAKENSHGPGLTVNVVLPLDAASNPSNLTQQLSVTANVTKSFSVHVWWGEVESQPGVYNWSTYTNLFVNIINATIAGAKIKANLNFHACKNDTDCEDVVNLPTWITNLENDFPGIFYTDVQGYSYKDYLTSGVDYVPIFAPNNRTAVQVYSDFIRSFLTTFEYLLDSSITEIQIGLGPAGEFRYPAFSSPDWKLPGIGQFQSYDKYLQNEYRVYAIKSGHPEFSYLPLSDAVSYNDIPQQASFFNAKKNDTAADYASFFSTWYTNRLLQHGTAILSQANSLLRSFSPNITLATRLGCVYWQFKDDSHAAELTAGYSNYTVIAEMLNNYGAVAEIGCFDLDDKKEQKSDDLKNAEPSKLLGVIFQAAQAAGITIEGTNTDLSTTKDNYDLIESNCRKDASTVTGFNYRYLSDVNANVRIFRELYDKLIHEGSLRK